MGGGYSEANLRRFIVKYIIFFVLFAVFPTGFAADAQTEQTVTVCSMVTKFEQIAKGCMEDSENCVLGLGASPDLPEDVKDILKALFTDIATSCEYTQTFVDLQCVLEKATAAKAEHCADSD